MDIHFEQAAQSQPTMSNIIDLPWLYRVIGLEKMILPKEGYVSMQCYFMKKQRCPLLG